MEDPTATPLYPTQLLARGREVEKFAGKKKKTYAAVEAICPNKPGPWLP